MWAGKVLLPVCHVLRVVTVIRAEGRSQALNHARMVR